jgi:ParB-like chromosome segregation protein Spo0J
MSKEKIEWTLKELEISDLIKYHRNPRKLTKKQLSDLKQSIKKFGLIDKPVVYQHEDKVEIIGGHQRIEALKELGYNKVNCWIVNNQLTLKELEELNIRLNKNSGEWDFDILANCFEIDDLIEWGFTADEFQIDLDALNEGTETTEQSDTLDKQVKITLTMSNDIASSFENQLDDLLSKFEGIKKTRK